LSDQTLTEAYADAGFVRKNTYWSWSAVDETRPAAALTVWDDQIVRTSEPWTMNPATFRDVAKWQHRNGNKERIRTIRFGLDRCEGWFHLILIRASDPDQEPRQILERRYMSERMGRIDEADFNPVTGEFLMTLHKL
jgi:hypothetical protein